MSDPDGLPLDSDTGPAQDANARQKPVHLSWESIGLVAAGGIVGTGLRYLITVVSPRWSGVPVATFAINIVGAFLLGVLLELLAERSIDAGWSRRLRLAVGTGGLGGFTTYSALATDTALLAAAHPAQAVGYALGTVLLGAVASAAGIWLSRGHLRPALVDAMNQS